VHGLPGSQPMFLHFVDTQQYDSPTLPEADCQFAVGPSGEVSERLNIYISLNSELASANPEFDVTCYPLFPRIQAFVMQQSRMIDEVSG
jgi:hypothetical protein